MSPADTHSVLSPNCSTPFTILGTVWDSTNIIVGLRYT